MLLHSLFLVTAILAAQVETTFTVKYGGKKYEFRIPDQDLQKTPAWPASQENPPLSANRAIDIASKELATLLPNGKDWRMAFISFCPLPKRCVYTLSFFLRSCDSAGASLI